MDFGSILSKSYFGIPGWLIAVAGGVGVWYFFLRGQSAGSSSSSSSGVSPDSAYGLGYAQGLQAAQANGTTGTTTVQGQNPPSNRPGTKKPSGNLKPPGGFNPGGAGGVGGFSSQGSRSSSWAGNYFDPRITRRVVYSHYVRAVGGPMTHRTEVASVAARSGIHVGRLQALNPVYTGKIRIA